MNEPLDLEPIKARLRLDGDDYGLTADPDWRKIDGDLAALVAEVERLRSLLVMDEA